MLQIGSPTAKNVPSGFLIPLALFTSKTVPAPMPVALIGREQDVRVRVAEVEVAAVAAAQDVPAVAAQIVGEPGARLDVVVVLARRLAEVLEPRQV